MNTSGARQSVQLQHMEGSADIRTNMDSSNEAGRLPVQRR